MGLGAAVIGAAVVGGVASNVAAKKAAKAQGKASDAAIGATKQAATEARADVNRIFPQAQATANQGFQGALDVFGQSVPAQFDVFQQGNVAAQQALISGLPQIQNAILGGNVDLSGLQPFQAQNVPTDLFQQRTPMNVQADLQAQQDAASMGPVAPTNFVNPPVNFQNQILGGGRFTTPHPSDRRNNPNRFFN
jgi:hypothetical protein